LPFALRVELALRAPGAAALRLLVFRPRSLALPLRAAFALRFAFGAVVRFEFDAPPEFPFKPPVLAFVFRLLALVLAFLFVLALRRGRFWFSLATAAAVSASAFFSSPSTISSDEGASPSFGARLTMTATV
jgi:hypothetical protein